MPFTIISKSVNIHKLPKNINTGKYARVTEGGLHANVIKLFYTLVERGLAEIADNYFENLVKICKKNEIYEDDIIAYKNILKAIKFNPAELRLLGDTTADRAGNDYLMLLAFELLQKNGIKVELLLSNHDMELIKAFEKGGKFQTYDIFPAPSIFRMQTLIDNNLVTKEEVSELYNRYYKPIINAIGYKLEINGAQKELTIYSHAGIGINSIKALAAKFDVAYKDNEPEELIGTIDQINEKIHVLLQEDKLHTMYSSNDEDNALFQLVWNRRYSHFQREAEHNGYRMNFVHGHDLGEKTLGNKVNLDNTLGKTVDMNKGQYTILYSGDPVPSTSLNKLNKNVAKFLSFFRSETNGIENSPEAPMRKM